MLKRSQIARVLVFAILSSLVLSCFGCGRTAEPEREAKILKFDKMAVETNSRTGFFGGRHASFKVTGSVTNNTDNPINKGNLPFITQDGNDDYKCKARLEEDKLLPGETCDVTWKDELTFDNGLPTLSFEGSVEYSGLDDVEGQLNEQIQAIADEYLSKDAQEEEDRKAKEQAKNEAESKKKSVKESLTDCKGKTSIQAYAIACETEYEPVFKDSYNIDVTADVKKAKEDSEIGKARVNKVEIEDAAWWWDASVTFTLDYTDPAAKKQRDDDAAADAARKKADKAVKVCKGKTADEALELANRSSYDPTFVDSYGVDVTDDVTDASNSSSVHEAIVAEIETADGFWFISPTITFTLDYVDPTAESERKEAEARKKEQEEREAQAKREKEEAEQALLNCKGRMASTARKTAIDSNVEYRFTYGDGNDITEEANDPRYLNARKRTKVTNVEIDFLGVVTFTLDKPLAITAQDDEEFARILKLKDNFDPSISTFAEQYRGEIVEFDGCFSIVDTENVNGKTHYTILVEAMDYDPNSAIGPTFQIRDMTFRQLNWAGNNTSLIRDGQNVRIVARLGELNGRNGLYQLKPLRIGLR